MIYKRIVCTQHLKRTRDLFVCMQLKGFKNCYQTLKIKFNISYLFAPSKISSMSSIDGTLTSTTTSGHSGPGSNSNEVVLHISRTAVSPLDAVQCHTLDTCSISSGGLAS